MDPVEGMLYGLQIALQPQNLLAAGLGAVAGTVIGLLPGFGPVAGAAILLPVTFALGPVAGVIMIAAIYYAVMYGGSTTAVLLNIPGEAPSVVAAIEGYPMSRAGRAGPALMIITMGSFFAAMVSIALTAIVGPYVVRIAILFGPAEFFALTLGGLLVLSRAVGGSLSASLVPMTLGMAIATVGQEPVAAINRFTFGHLDLARGISISAVAIGLFGISEIVVLASQTKRAEVAIPRLRLRDLTPSRRDLREAMPAWIRGIPIGFGMGLLPGPSAALATFASYRVERGLAKDKTRLGKGYVPGLAGPEAANNAAATSSVIPVIALGIPFSATLALMLAALIVHGVTPGPLLATQEPEIFWGLIASMLIGNLALVMINIPLIGVWVSFLRIPYRILLPVVAVLAIAGTYSVNRSATDLVAVLALGLVGLAIKWANYQMAPLLVGFILGPLVERYLREALMLDRGDVWSVVSSGIAGYIWLAVLLALGISSVQTSRRRRRTKRGEASESGIDKFEDDEHGEPLRNLNDENQYTL